MKKVYLLFLLLIFIVFSCKGTPKTDEGADESGLSQLEITAEEDDEVTAEFDEKSKSDEDMLVQDGITDELQADAQIEEQPIIVEETPPLAPQITAVPPPSAPKVTATVPPPVVTVIEKSPPVTDISADDQAAQSESAVEQKPPPRSQPWLVPPPAVSAVKDDAPVPNRQGLLLPKEDEIVFSRTVRVTVGQIVEIPFRGTGWVYLGELTSRRGLVYNSHRLDPEGQSFIFMAEEAGTYALKFYKQDFIRDYILNDYVQVIVGESPSGGGAGWFNPPSARGRITAEPRWPSALDESAMLRGGARAASGSTSESALEKKNGASATQPVLSANKESAPAGAQGTSSALSVTSQSPSQITPQSPPITSPQIPQSATETPAMDSDILKQEKLPPEEILKKAQETFNEGNTAAAIALLDQFMEYYPNGSDELYWLYGQFYEANTPHRNILLSLDYYRRLVNEYPQSRRYNDARRRIAYLERFYINIQ